MCWVSFFQFEPQPFAMCLKGIAKGAKRIVLMLSYPSDEVGTIWSIWINSTRRGSIPTGMC
jgi:hypothetical protein